MEEKKVELNLGLVCNNLCKFCINATPARRRRFVPFEVLKKELYDFYKDGYRQVGFLGGEPTIYPDLAKLISLATHIGYIRIHLVSNGRKYSNINFLKKLTDSGLIRFYVSIHSHKSEIEDYLTSVKGGFDEKIKGLLNLVILKNKGLIKERIFMNLVINRFNYKYLSEILYFYKKNFALTDFRFNFIRPSGRAFKNFNLLVPRYSQVKQYLLEAMNLSRQLKLNLTLEGVPFCFLSDVSNFQEFVGEFRDGIRQVRFGSEIREEFFIEQRRRDELKEKNRSCRQCIYDSSCEGPWKNYVKIYNFKEFRPIKHAP